jgi:hypothetical protein
MFQGDQKNHINRVINPLKKQKFMQYRNNSFCMSTHQPQF